MEGAALRAIGRRVYAKIKGMGLRGQEPLERGAGGDRSFPVDKLAEKEILEGLDAIGEPLRVITEEAGIIELGQDGGHRPYRRKQERDRGAAVFRPVHSRCLGR
jgi:DNA-binding transcriptional ArsR family regulator